MSTYRDLIHLSYYRSISFSSASFVKHKYGIKMTGKMIRKILILKDHAHLIDYMQYLTVDSS